MTNGALVARKLAAIDEHLRRIDAERLWAELPSGMASFEAFAAAVSAFLTSRMQPPPGTLA